MARLLIVHHSPSPAMAELLDAVVSGANDPDISGIEIVRRAALVSSATDLLAADGVVLGTPANIGYMSGALKHWFDTIYYVCADDTRGLPFGLWVHGNLDVSGAVRSVGTITGGLGWQQVAAPVEVLGAPDRDARERCYELGATVAATIAGDGD